MLKKLLGFDPQTMALRTEIIAGITTFLTMSYILAVNPSILATTGMDKGAVFTATALASALATLLLAFMAKLPFAQAPSMALNAFFRFYVGAGHGLFLADRYDSDVCGGGDLYPDYVSERPGGDLE